jgi:DNA-binding response OmpR family regulator
VRVLIAEDTRAFGELIAQSLERASMASDLVFTAADAESALARINYEAIVLDLGLPDRDGLDLLCELRARRDTTPVLIISARHGFQDRVLGLKEGADDYLAKPFAMDELVARLQAVLRRPPALAGDLLRAGNVSLDPRTRLVRVDGQVQKVRLPEPQANLLVLARLGIAFGSR